ncbi:hypothetical protein LINGRAHAP2_LOCUS30720 [Linum grandiflorum]
MKYPPSYPIPSQVSERSGSRRRTRIGLSGGSDRWSGNRAAAFAAPFLVDGTVCWVDCGGGSVPASVAALIQVDDGGGLRG